MDKQAIKREISFKTSKSSGPGGQHVNKVSTKVELLFDIEQSIAFTPEEKARLLLKLQKRINKEGMLIIQSQSTRSQSKNKKDAEEKLYQTLESALIVPKRRKKTRPSKQVKEKRLKSKKINSMKKVNRRKIDF